jgi:hypothetical protein
MTTKLNYGLPPQDYGRIAANAVREVRAILAAEPETVRGIYWAVLWEAARVSHKQLLLAVHGASQLYQPSASDTMLAARLALACYFRTDLLVELPRPSAEVRPFRRSEAVDAE